MKLLSRKYILGVVLLIVSGMILFSGSPDSPPEWKKGKPKHHTTEGFRNYPVILEKKRSLGISFFFNRFTSSFTNPEVPETHYLSERDAVSLLDSFKNKNSITWIGQSTMLIKIDGTYILTDPFFSKLASPLPFGPERYAAPGISLEGLPSVDIIIISHNHYDHLDADFIEALPGKERINVFVPLRLKKFFSDRGYKHVHELDWYETHSIHNIALTALPSVHYSSRSYNDKNKTLWCSWAIVSPYGKYYFIGDSAYSPTLFKDIGKKFGTFDLAMVTIGTYGNRKYGVNNHTNPEEAVAIGKDLRAKALLGIHWGTIDLSDENAWEPPGRFKESAEKNGFRGEDVWVMKIGETRGLGE